MPSTGGRDRSLPLAYTHDLKRPRTPDETTPLHTVDVQRKKSDKTTAIIIVLSVLVVSQLLYITVDKFPHALDWWNKEREEHGRNHKEWEHEEKEQKRTQEQEEQRRQEEEKKRKDELKELGLYWGDIEAAKHCFSYGVREYSARIYNLPFWSDWEYGCQNTPAEIKGKILNSPYHCESRGMWGMYGRWLVSFDEPLCMPYWGTFDDKECVAEGSGLRRVESKLFGVASGEDWAKMCATAPASIHGSDFEHPTYCDHKGIWGIYGGWEVPDDNC